MFGMMLNILQEIVHSYSKVSTKFMRCVFTVLDRVSQTELFQATRTDLQHEQLRKLLYAFLSKPESSRIEEFQQQCAHMIHHLEQQVELPSPVSEPEQLIADAVAKQTRTERMPRMVTMSDGVTRVTGPALLLELRTGERNAYYTGKCIADYILTQLVEEKSSPRVLRVFVKKAFSANATEKKAKTLWGFVSNFLGQLLRLHSLSGNALQALVGELLDAQAASVIEHMYRRISPELAEALLSPLFIARTTQKQREAWQLCAGFCERNFVVLLKFIMLHRDVLSGFHVDQFFRLSVGVLEQFSEDVLARLARQMQCLELNMRLAGKVAQSMQLEGEELRQLLDSEYPRFVSFLCFRSVRNRELSGHLIQQYRAVCGEEGTRLRELAARVEELLQTEQPDEETALVSPAEIDQSNVREHIFLVDGAQLTSQHLQRLANLLAPPYEDYRLLFFFRRELLVKILYIASQKAADPATRGQIGDLFYWLSFLEPGQVQGDLIKALVENGYVGPQLFYVLANQAALGGQSYKSTYGLTADECFRRAVREYRMEFDK